LLHGRGLQVTAAWRRSATRAGTGVLILLTLAACCERRVTSQSVSPDGRFVAIEELKNCAIHRSEYLAEWW